MTERQREVDRNRQEDRDKRKETDTQTGLKKDMKTCVQRTIMSVQIIQEAVGDDETDEKVTI